MILKLSHLYSPYVSTDKKAAALLSPSRPNNNLEPFHLFPKLTQCWWLHFGLLHVIKLLHLYHMLHFYHIHNKCIKHRLFVISGFRLWSLNRKCWDTWGHQVSVQTHNTHSPAFTLKKVQFKRFYWIQGYRKKDFVEVWDYLVIRYESERAHSWILISETFWLHRDDGILQACW